MLLLSDFQLVIFASYNLLHSSLSLLLDVLILIVAFFYMFNYLIAAMRY